MSDAVESLGGRLKAERERKGFTAQKAADQLHLDAWVIEALESGDYARIGPSVYGKGHLKRYAGLLGLSPDEIAGAYENRPVAPAAAAQPSLQIRGVEPPERAPGRTPAVAVAAVILVMAAAALLAWWRPWRAHPAAVAGQTSGAPAPGIGAPTAAGAGGRAEDGGHANRSGGGSAGGGSASAGDELAGAPPAAGAGPSAATAATTSATAPTAATDTVAGIGRARLRLSFSADSWVDVHDAAGRRLFAGRGRANSVRTIAGAAPMKVYLGFASGVQVEVNNRVVAIGPQFVAGDVARFEAGADGVLRRDLRATAAGDPHPRG